MSIFKDTLKPEVIAQLRARQYTVSQDNRETKYGPFIDYQTKNSWVKMTSLVNYDSGEGIEVDYNNIVKVIPDSFYTGDQLSRKYVLFGGTPYTNPSNNNVSMRSGVDKQNAVYGSNIDWPSFSNTGFLDRPFGARPMPGIRDVQISSKSAYGSLREAVVKFYCWDRHQLEELEILFMRPGYSVLLEWGWSKYIDYDNQVEKTLNTVKEPNFPTTPNNFSTSNFTEPFINAYDPNLNQQYILDTIADKIKKTKCNYDAMLGYIRNFNWTMLDNGGYECTTTLISIGEVISSLKISSNPSEGDQDVANIFADPENVKEYQYNDYEKILLALKASLGNHDVDFEPSGAYANFPLNNFDVAGTITDFGKKLKSRDTNRLSNLPNSYQLYNEYIPILSGSVPWVKEYNSIGEEITNKNNEYIPFNTWLAMMDSYFLLKDDKNEKYLYYEIKPFNFGGPLDFNRPNQLDPIYCLAAPDSISIDPSVCYVDNEFAFPEVAYIYSSYKNLGNKGVLSKLQPYYSGVYRYKNFYRNDKRLGVLQNININIDFLLNTYKNMNSSTNNDGVDILAYTQNILNGISTALGGLNNFKVFADNNVLRIGDAYYVEDPTNAVPSKKFQFDLMGLKSICRDVNITSKIFPEQSTMIAIAAQDKGNVGDIYSSTQTLFNAGLTDRIAKSKSQASTPLNSTHTPETIQANTDKLYNKLLLLSAYIKKYVIGTQEFPNVDVYSITKAPNPASASSTLRSILLQFNPEINFKALIPFELEITLDGIGGFVIGQIFTVNKNILPKDYFNKNLGFIITGISHNLVKNDWTTTIKTQICLLNDEDGGLVKNIKTLSTGLYNARIAKIQELLNKYTLKSLNYAILRDFILYQLNKSIASFMYANNSGDSVLGVNVYEDIKTPLDYPTGQAQTFVSLTERYNSLVQIQNVVDGTPQQAVTDYFNGNAGDLVNKPGSKKWYPAKQFVRSFTLPNVGNGSRVPIEETYADGYGYTQFAKDWITSLKSNTTSVRGERLSSVSEITITIGQVLDKYETEINQYINNSYSDYSTFEAFDPSLYLSKIKDDLSLSPTNTLLTPDNTTLYNQIFFQNTKEVFFAVGGSNAIATRYAPFNYLTIDYDKVNNNIINYLNTISTTTPDLLVLHALLFGNINSNVRETKDFTSSPVYKGYNLTTNVDFLPVTVRDRGGNVIDVAADNDPVGPNPTNASIRINKEFIEYYQITGGRDGAVGATNTPETAREPYTRHRN